MIIPQDLIFRILWKLLRKIKNGLIHSAKMNAIERVEKESGQKRALKIDIIQIVRSFYFQA